MKLIYAGSQKNLLKNYHTRTMEIKKTKTKLLIAYSLPRNLQVMKLLYEDNCIG